MTAPEPTQPLTDDPLAGMRKRVAAYEGPDHYRFTIDGIEYDGHWVHDARRALAEADRLRTELTEAHRTAGAEHGRAGAMEAAYREACTARDARDTEIERLRAELRNERERLNEALAENVRRLGEITGLRTELRGCRNLGVEYERLRVENIELTTKAAQAWSEGHSTALAAGCDSEDEFRANLGVLLVAEEQRCQLAIKEEPYNFHLHGHLSGLKRARDIVTGEAFALDQSGEGQANG